MSADEQTDDSLSIGQKCVLIPWTILVVVCSIHFLMYVAQTIRALLVQFGVHDDIAWGIALPFLMPGVYWLILFLVSLPIFWWLRHTSKTPFLTLFVFLSLPLFLMIFVWWSSVGEDGMAVSTAIVATIVAIIMGICCTPIFLWMDRFGKGNNMKRTQSSDCGSDT